MSDKAVEANVGLVHAIFRALSDGRGGPAGLDEVIERVCHPAFVDHGRPPQFSANREGYKGILGAIMGAFSDLHYEVIDTVAAGDRVVCRATLSARHTAPFLGLPATGRSFSIHTMHMYRAADGKLVEHWANRDDLGMMQQLGVLPPLGGPPPGGGAPV